MPATRSGCSAAACTAQVGAGQCDQHGPLGVRRVQHGDDVCCALGVGIGGGADRVSDERPLPRPS